MPESFQSLSLQPLSKESLLPARVIKVEKGRGKKKQKKPFKRFGSLEMRITFAAAKTGKSSSKVNGRVKSF